MMLGTILSNFWVALIAFTVYFLFSYPFIEGMGIILEASIISVGFFLLTFLARAIISYIMSNPQEEIKEIAIQDEASNLKSEISSEDYAELVKTMLVEDEKTNTI
ncbi:MULTISPECIES: hypothetical protein [Psychrobacillus]|uniref:hypothetical protein n=1 Tax=Psychrobacillus TaxID=1221880 RepID=UPI0030FBB2CD